MCTTTINATIKDQERSWNESFTLDGHCSEESCKARINEIIENFNAASRSVKTPLELVSINSVIFNSPKKL